MCIYQYSFCYVEIQNQGGLNRLIIYIAMNIWIIQQFGIIQTSHILETIVPPWLLSFLCPRNMAQFLLHVALIHPWMIPMVIAGNELTDHNKIFFYHLPPLPYSLFYNTTQNSPFTNYKFCLNCR